MEKFYITDPSYIPFYEYHACSYTRIGDKIQIELPSEGYEALSLDLLCLKYVRVTTDKRYHILLCDKVQGSTKTLNVYDNPCTHYIPFANLLTHLVHKGYVVYTNMHVEFLVNDMLYLRLFTVLIHKLNETGMRYQLKVAGSLEPSILNAYTIKIPKKTISEYTENTNINTKFITLLEHVNYELQHTDKDNYYVTMPYYKKNCAIASVIADAIFAYYLFFK